ncbi:hypothetical protein [Paraburkholderia sp. J12]|uniref:hypothetical protein n=1 Tax=Paraburkholderia sp. J12 TaxID=2805432 RepID=UPI002ABE1414|nr:hypothetical protein [Paraburkholderia sp. J12]
MLIFVFTNGVPLRGCPFVLPLQVRQQRDEKTELLEVVFAQRRVNSTAEVAPARLALEHRQPAALALFESGTRDVIAATAWAARPRFVTPGQQRGDLRAQEGGQFRVFAGAALSGRGLRAELCLHPQNCAVT